MEQGFWYTSTSGNIIFITTKRISYGVVSRRWVDDAFDNNTISQYSQFWRKSSVEEIMTMLENQCIERYGDNWRTLEYDSDQSTESDVMSDQLITSYSGKIIYNAGVWSSALFTESVVTRESILNGQWVIYNDWLLYTTNINSSGIIEAVGVASNEDRYHGHGKFGASYATYIIPTNVELKNKLMEMIRNKIPNNRLLVDATPDQIFVHENGDVRIGSTQLLTKGLWTL